MNYIFLFVYIVYGTTHLHSTNTIHSIYQKDNPWAEHVFKNAFKTTKHSQDPSGSSGSTSTRSSRNLESIIIDEFTELLDTIPLRSESKSLIELNVPYHKIVGSRNFGEKTLWVVHDVILDPYEPFQHKRIQVWTESFQKELSYSQSIHKIKFQSHSFNQIYEGYYMNMQEFVNGKILFKLLNRIQLLLHSESNKHALENLEKSRTLLKIVLKGQKKLISSKERIQGIRRIQDLETFRSQQLAFLYQIKTLTNLMYDLYHSIQESVDRGVDVAFHHPLSHDSVEFMKIWVEYSVLCNYKNNYNSISMEYIQRVKLGGYYSYEQSNQILQNQKTQNQNQRMNRESFLMNVIHDTVHSRYTVSYHAPGSSRESHSKTHYKTVKSFAPSDIDKVKVLGKQLSRNIPGETSLLKKVIQTHKDILLEKINRLLTPDQYDLMESAWEEPYLQESIEAMDKVIKELIQSGYHVEAMYLTTRFQDHAQLFEESFE